MVDIQTVSIAIASAGVLVGVIYYILDLRHQTRIRKTDLLIRFYSTSTSTEFWDAWLKVISLQVKDYQDYVKQYGSMLSEAPMHRALLTVTGFYELVGVLLYRKLIDLGSVFDVIGSGHPKMIYEKIKPLVLGIRREFNDPSILLGFEYLYNELTRKEPQLRKMWEKAILPTVSSSNSSSSPLGVKNG